MRKKILIAFVVLVMCQTLLADPVPEPEAPQLFRSYIFIPRIQLVSYPILGYRQIFRSSASILSNIVANVIAASSTVLNSTMQNMNRTFNTSCNRISAVQSQFCNATNVTSCGLVLGSNIIFRANLGVTIIGEAMKRLAFGLAAYGVTVPTVFKPTVDLGALTVVQPENAPQIIGLPQFFNFLVNPVFGVPQINFGNVNYPSPILPIPPQPSTLPLVGTIGVISKISQQVPVIIQSIQLVVNELQKTQSSLEQLKNVTGVNCTAVNASSIQEIVDLFAQITNATLAQSNNQTNALLVSSLSSATIAQISDAYNKTSIVMNNFTQFMSCANGDLRNRSCNPFEQLISGLTLGAINKLSFIQCVKQIIDQTAYQGLTFIRNSCGSSIQTIINGWSAVNGTVNSLINLINNTVTNYGNNVTLLRDNICRPALVALQTTLFNVPNCVRSIFDSITNNASVISNATLASISAISLNASTVVNATTQNLTNWITNDATTFTDCQFYLNAVQTVSTEFNSQAAACYEQSINQSQQSVTNSSNVAVTISTIFNNITSRVDQCLNTNGVSSFLGINALPSTTRQVIATCLYKVASAANQICRNATALSVPLSNNMTATDIAALSSAQTCTDAKVNEALISAGTIITNYDECTKGLFRRR
ncbi:unnamed protein product [Diamesa hyperborea]